MCIRLLLEQLHIYFASLSSSMGSGAIQFFNIVCIERLMGGII